MDWKKKTRAFAESLDRAEKVIASSPTLSLAEYREQFANAARPTTDQMQGFVDYVCEAHSWYKTLPPFSLDGDPFHFFFNPTCGMDQTVDRSGRRRFGLRKDGDEKLHYTWMPTKEYRSRFGFLDYAAGCGSCIAFDVGAGALSLEDTIVAIHLPDGSPRRLPKEILSVAQAKVTALIHPEMVGFARIALRIWKQKDDAPVDPIREKVVEIVAKSRAAQRAAQHDNNRFKHFDEYRAQVKAAFAPERARQREAMMAAIVRVTDLVYGESER